MEPALTFGIELEFLLPALDPGVPDPCPHDPRRAADLLSTPIPNFAAVSALRNEKRFDALGPVAQALSNALNAAHIRAFPFFALTGSSLAGPPRDPAGAWEVKYDTSLTAPPMPASDPRRAYRWFGMEVASPAFFAVEEAFAAVAAVCAVLSGEFRAEVNASCGLHVHVGRRGAGLPLAQTRNLMAVLWALEPQIHGLHPARRTRGEAYFCKPLRRRRWVGRGRPELDDCGAVARIYGEATEGTLVRWLNTGAFHAYKLENLVHAGFVSTKRTVEFRQHEGTLEGGRVVAWARFVVRVVEWAGWVDADRITEFLVRELERQRRGEEGVGLLEFVRMLGLHEVVAVFDEVLKERAKEVYEDEDY